jgi:hypothetical protein
VRHRQVRYRAGTPHSTGTSTCVYWPCCRRSFLFPLRKGFFCETVALTWPRKVLALRPRRLMAVGGQLGQLEAAKAAAIAREDYDAAKALKVGSPLLT